jgi:hypothetical protein
VNRLSIQSSLLRSTLGGVLFPMGRLVIQTFVEPAVCCMQFVPSDDRLIYPGILEETPCAHTPNAPFWFSIYTILNVSAYFGM